MEAHKALDEILLENARLKQKLYDMRYIMAGALTHSAPDEPTFEWLKSNFAETQYRIRQAVEAAA